MLRLWTQNDILPDELKWVFQKLNENVPPLFRLLKERLADPSGRNRKNCAVILMDSTKIRIVKSSNRSFQSSTFYQPRGKHFITETHGVGLNGEVVMD